MSQFSVGKSTLNDILRSKEKFKKFKAEKEELGLSGTAKTAKKSRERRLWQARQRALHCIRQEREKGCLVTGPILLEKASKFHRLIYGKHSRPFKQIRGFNEGFAGDLACVILKFVAKN